MKPSDLPQLTSASSPTVSPDGSRAVFAVTRPDLGADTYVGQLWQVAIDGGAPAERLTRGFRDTSPAFSPDGALIAFLRATSESAPQLYVVRASGGEPVLVTAQTLGVSQFSWSPDSSRIAFIARVPEKGRYGTVTGLGASAEPGRVITTTRYLSNGVGFVVDRRAQVFVVDVPDVTAEPPVAPVATVEGPAEGAQDPDFGLPSPVQITEHDADHSRVRFTPAGDAVTFVAALHEHRDFDLRSSAWQVGIAADGSVGTTVELVTTSADLSVDDVLVARSGAVFVLAGAVGETGLDFVASNTALFTAAGPGEPLQRLTDPETTDLSGTAMTRAADDSVFVTDTVRGTVQLLRVDSSGATERLTHDDIEVTGVASSDETVILTIHDSASMGDVARLDGAGSDTGRLTRLTDFGAGLRETGLIEARELLVPVSDGTEIQGWVLVPEGAGPHPTLLVIHGGPYAQFTGSVFDEAQVYAAAGYGVVMCNPRGAAGYGQAFGRSIKEAMGTVDMTDVLDYLDGALAANPTLDGERLGIMGGSYGGYLTAWTIAHDHRFAGAIVERGFLDPELFTGTSDIGTFFAEQYAGHDPEKQKTQSPQAFVHQVTTPTFVVHSEDDLRCPLSQAERYHLGLVRAGVPTKMLIFPGENHELSRAGRPRHRLQRFEAILDWWNDYLPVGGADA